MKIAFVKSYFLWAFATGGERSQIAVLSALARAGHDVTMRYAIPPGLPEAAYRSFLEIIESFELELISSTVKGVVYFADGVRVEALRVASHPGMWLGSWLDELEPKMILASAKDTLFLPILAAFWPGRGGIFVQDLESLNSARRLLKPESLAHFFSPNWTLIASSRFLQGKTRDIVGLDSEILYPLVNMEIGEHSSPSANTVTLFGTSRGKGYDLFQSVASGLPHRGFRAVLGWEEQATRCPPNVELVPFSLSPEKLLGTTAVVVVPSRLPEGFGRVALESMAYGRPVLVSDQGALPEVVGDAGIIVPATTEGHEPARWIAALRSLEDPARARKHVDAGLGRAREIRNLQSHQFKRLFGDSLVP